MLLSLVTLLLGIVSRSYEGYEALLPRVVKLLHRLNPEKERDAQGRSVVLDRASVPPEYAYYGIPSPWLQVGFVAIQLACWHSSISQSDIEDLQNVQHCCHGRVVCACR